MSPNDSAYEVSNTCISKTDDVVDKREGLNFPCLTFFPNTASARCKFVLL